MNYSKRAERAKRKLEEISKKNEGKEYSLGDVLLLDMFEKQLKNEGYTEIQIKEISPSFYDSYIMNEL